MGNICRKKKRQVNDNPESTEPTIISHGFGSPTKSPVEKWEEKQKEQNAKVMERMREDFHTRPDNFLLNLLVLSLQFYQNYNKEKATISHHIRDREQGLGKKLTPSKRKIIYMGGFEEISGTHVLYQSKYEKYMELPTPLQVYIIQDNLDVYPDEHIEELQKRNYTDLDGPSYRFGIEYSQRHKGYVRLRCADIIPGATRNNTYEDIYAFMAPVDDSLPDPIVDLRPLRRNSLISTAEDDDNIPHLPACWQSSLPSLTSFEEENENDSSGDEMVPPPPALMGRRPSGVMPLNYPNKTLHLSTSRKTSNTQQNGFPGANIKTQEPQNIPNLTERRPSGIFPKMSPNMDQLSLTKKDKKKINTQDEFANLKRVLAGIEEESEEEEEGEDEVDGGNNAENKTYKYLMRDLTNSPPDPPEEEIQLEDSDQPKELPQLDAALNKGCFMDRKIKIKEEGDAYGVKTRTELRTYFSSIRYLECFEDDFHGLLTILGKEHLIDASSMQMPAILASQLMIEGIGPKYNTEFIPSIILKEWPNCAFEWKLRERKPRNDPETKMVYRWPKPQNIEEVTKMGCNLVPIGHYNPSQPNTVMKIEWQIQFARAEQILLRSLGHSQIRLLLLVEFLMKDHMKDIPGLKTQHLRYILYWMCEHNFRDWQEERLGTKLKAYLKTLYNCLSTENLPHYFIDKCNLMETIPERYLRQIQALVRNMKDNLPMYLMHTMRRMRTEDDFYPMLDIKALYKLVTPEHYGMDKINPALLSLMGGDGKSEFDDGEDVLYSDSEEEKEHKMLKEKLHEIRRQKSKKEVTNKGVTERRKKSTINLRKKVQSVKDLRSGKLLSTFATHFIQMARCSNKYRSYPQAYMYLLLAGNMATLLEETGNGEEARDFRKTIEELNYASRGGVQDMLGSSWAITDNFDIIPGYQNNYGSNWELKKESQPLPQPPKHISPVSKVKFSKSEYTESMGDNLSKLENSVNSKPYLTQTFSGESISDIITDLPESVTDGREASTSMNQIIIVSDDDDFSCTNL
ncbi:uncharacterized protein [Palaemon carinicauda]|uniref:uncharacterized protein n=1 Tax=Palaemon carinicauda TaxID=392227 RepID=UPI0035B6603F